MAEAGLSPEICDERGRFSTGESSLLKIAGWGEATDILADTFSNRPKSGSPRATSQHKRPIP